MALALGMTKYTPAATKALIAEGPVARAAYFKRVIEGMGGKVLWLRLRGRPGRRCRRPCRCA